MSNNMRHRRYDSNALELSIALATEADQGDLIGISANKAVKASSVAFDASLTDDGNGEAFADVFAGIAETASKSTDDEDLVVGQNGDWEMPCASTDWKVGDYVGIANDGSVFENQKVRKVTASGKSGSIGRCVFEESSATTVLFRLRTSLSVEGPV